MDTGVYRDMAARTGGDIYIGVVGPVRTGKSTFIKRFMDLLVLPELEEEQVRARLVDEMPQSGAGKTIMTTQPHFVPNDAVTLSLGESMCCSVRMVDCVGYWVQGAGGHEEDGTPRMVRTPWFDHDIPFEEAAELGTRKVIRDHSTIGVVVTTDGSISGIPRENYVEAEERVVAELKALQKPFVVVLNCISPDSEQNIALAAQLREKYGVSVLPLDVMNLSKEQANDILRDVLLAFPMELLQVKLPGWLLALPPDHWLLQQVLEPLREALPTGARMGEYHGAKDQLSGLENFGDPTVETVALGTGTVTLEMQPKENLFYTILGESCGMEIPDDARLLAILKECAQAKQAYDRLQGALQAVHAKGYGVVPPTMAEMELDDPELIQQGSRYGVRLRAKAAGLHLIRVDVETEIAPIIGTEQQSRALIQYLADTVRQDPGQIWETNIFGKSLYDLVREGMESKIEGLPDTMEQKLQKTLQRIVNDGCSGMICLLY